MGAESSPSPSVGADDDVAAGAGVAAGDDVATDPNVNGEDGPDGAPNAKGDAAGLLPNEKGEADAPFAGAASFLASLVSGDDLPNANPVDMLRGRAGEPNDVLVGVFPAVGTADV